MSLTGEKGDSDYVAELMDAGSFVGRCNQVIDLGMQESTWKGKTKMVHKIRIGFEFPGELRKEGEDAGKPFTTANRYTLSLGDKANLRKDLQSWRGKNFTEKELEGFDISKLLGVPAMVGIIHNKSGDKTYANISSLSKIPKGMECPAAVWPPLLYDADNGADASFEALPEWIQGQINIPAKDEDVNQDAASEDDGSDIPF